MITASRMGDVLAGPETDRRWAYIRDVVADIVGSPDWDETRTPSWFSHGKEWEQEAKDFYTFMTGYDVIDVAFVRHPHLQFVGCSPDGFIGADGGVEIKCTYKLDVLDKVRQHGLQAMHKPQVQANLWITGRRWWDYAVYYRSYNTTDCGISIHRILPDKEYHAKLSAACHVFWKQCEELANERLRGRWKNRQARRTKDQQQGVAVLPDGSGKRDL